MPIVNGKEFPYTKAGKKAAKKVAKTATKKKKVQTSDGYMKT